MNLLKLFKKRGHPEAARALYALAVAQARQPEFYTRLGLPDTAEGRLEAVMLHVWLIFHRLKGKPATKAAEVSQALYDVFFEDMDQSLREMGVGDLGVPHRIKAMAEAFMGRIAAYDAAIGAPETTALEEAFRRNFYRTAPAAPSDAHLQGLVAYVMTVVRSLEMQPLGDFLDGKVLFPFVADGESS